MEQKPAKPRVASPKPASKTSKKQDLQVSLPKVPESVAPELGNLSLSITSENLEITTATGVPVPLPSLLSHLPIHAIRSFLTRNVSGSTSITFLFNFPEGILTVSICGVQKIKSLGGYTFIYLLIGLFVKLGFQNNGITFAKEAATIQLGLPQSKSKSFPLQTLRALGPFVGLKITL